MNMIFQYVLLSIDHKVFILCINLYLVNECPELASPANGYHGCDDWHIGTYCKPKCNDGFSFLTPQISDYHCTAQGEWAPSNQVPACQCKWCFLLYIHVY